MTYSLPTTLTVGGKAIPIRTSYQAALEIITALADPSWTPAQKAEILLTILYKQPIPAQYTEDAIKQAYWYLDGGQDYKQSKKKSPTVMDWEKDWGLIVAPINRVIGHDIRSDADLHWWTFLSAYMEIGGDCLLAQVISIRDKKARNEKLEQYEKKWAARNADLLALPQRYTQEEDATLEKFGIKRKG